MNSMIKQLNHLAKEALPPPLEGHQLRFQRKLQRQNKPIVKMMTWVSIAASIVLVIGLSTSTLESTPNANQELTHFYETQIEAQLEVLEVSYQDQYAIPLQDIKQELKRLDQDYKTLQVKFEENHQHPLVLKAMIDNLQQQLAILNELEQTLNELKTAQHENELL